MGKKIEILDKGKDVQIVYLDFSGKNENNITDEITKRTGETED